MFGLGFNSYYSRQHRLRVYRACKSSQDNEESNEEQQETEEDMIEKDAEYAIISKIIEEPCFITLHKYLNRIANAQNDHGKMLLAYGVKGAEGRDSTDDNKMRIINSWQDDDQKKKDSQSDNEKYPEILIDISKIVSAVETVQDYTKGNYTYICKLTCLYTQGMSTTAWNIIEPVEEIYRLIEEAKSKKLEKILKLTKKLRAIQLQDNSTQQETEEL